MIPLLLKEQSPVSFKCHLNRSIHSLSVEKGSNQIAIIGSMVGLLLLLMVIVGVALLFIL